LLALALVLRAWGISWGVPDGERYYPYHPDESVLLNAVCQVNPLWLDFTPQFYNYGSFYILLTRLVYDLGGPMLGWGSVPRFDLPFEKWVVDFGHLLLTARWVSVVMGVATVAAVFALGRRLFGTRTGLLAAVFLAVAPLPVLLGHYMAVDVPSTFLVTLALCLGANAMDLEDGRKAVRWILAGAFIGGLAVGTKYNTFPALLPLAVPVWQLWRRAGSGRGLALVSITGSAFVSLAAFFLSTPGALLESAHFLKDVLYELERNREGQGLIFKATPPAVVYHLTSTLPIGLEWPLYLLALVGIGWSVKRRRPEDVYLWLFLVPAFLLLVPSERKFLRYVTPLIPILILFAARVIDEGIGTPRRRIWVGAAAAGAAFALASSVAHLGVLAAPDARDQAAAYLRQHVRPDETVALASDSAFYTPPVHPTAGAVKVAQMYGGPPIWDLPVAMGHAREDVTRLPQFKVLAPRSLPSPAGALTVEQLEAMRPEWLVISDYEYEDPERIHRADPSFTHGTLVLQDALAGDYRLDREIRPRPSLVGLTWWSRGIPPHDWRYYMPTVRIYRRGT